MIVDLILLMVQGILNVLLLPLEALNVAVDVVSSIPVVAEFLQIVAYLLPWTNILPLLIIVVSVFIFRITMAIIKIIWHFIPVFGN